MKRIAAKGSSEAFLRRHLKFSRKKCLIWPFRLVPYGYGLAVVGGVQKRASRWMCILAHGDPPFHGAQAAHSCGNPSCVNPRHIRWATPKDNMNDKLIHGTEIRGERNGKTTLTATDIKTIRSAPAKLAPLMLKFGVSKGCISKIRAGSRW